MKRYLSYGGGKMSEQSETYDPYAFAAEYILRECSSLHWWQLNKKWKAIKAREMAKIIVDEAIEMAKVRAREARG